MECNVIVKLKQQYDEIEGCPESTGLALQVGESDAAVNSVQWQL